MKTDADSRLTHFLACLDDARLALQEAERHARPLLDELPSTEPWTFVLKQSERMTHDAVAKINNVLRFANKGDIA